MTTLTVDSAAALRQGLAAAKAGDVILLAPGNYGLLSLYSARETYARFAGPVTLKSVDPSRKASLSGMMLRGVSNLTLDSLKFDYVAAFGASDATKPFLIRESEAITVRNSVFDGDLAQGLGDVLDGFGTGHGLTVTNGCKNITVEGNEFINWMRAAVFSDSSGLVVKANDIHDMRSDGLNFSGVIDVLIEGNHLHDFRKAVGSTDHMDMIQFWTSGTVTPTTDVTIRKNILDSSAGNLTQSIFMRNEEVDSRGAGLEMFYRDILIEENLIHNAHAHGITVGETVNLAIRNNTLLHNRDSASGKSVNIPAINLKPASQNVEIASNILPAKYGTPPAATAARKVVNNLVVQYDAPANPNHVVDLFVNPLAGRTATLTDLQAKPGGLIEQMGVGAAMTRAGVAAPAPAPAAAAPAPAPAPTAPRKRKGRK